jgi:hypothetical protein
VQDDDSSSSDEDSQVIYIKRNKKKKEKAVVAPAPEPARTPQLDSTILIHSSLIIINGIKKKIDIKKII